MNKYLIDLVEEMNNIRRAAILWEKINDYIKNLNLFPFVPPSIDENEVRTQRISTRLFIFLWILSMSMLLLYTSLIINSETITVERPSLAEYSYLNSIYSQTLTCPCSKVSINYGEFIHVEYTLHQVCSSVFVDHTWLDYLFNVPPLAKRFIYDFRVGNPERFQTLRKLCELINSTISNSSILFYSNQHVNAFVIRQELLKSQIQSLTDQFRSSTANSFSLSLAIIRDTTQINALFSAAETNYILQISAAKTQIFMHSESYDGCECVISSSCVKQAAFYKHPNSTPLFVVRGFYAGCSVVESLLQSTLECLYDESCLNQLQSHISSSSSIDMNAIPLNASSPTKYVVTSTIQELVDNLMIEEWNVSMMYETYYNECQPTQCSYTIERRNDVIYIVTTLFGIAGGLNTVLQHAVPRFVRFVVSWIGRRRMTVVPETVAVAT
jgi:hypothetical protein